MGALARFERRLGGAVEGGFTRLFRSRVEPVELAVALKRECDDERAIGGTNTLVPNEFQIELGASDYDRLAPYILTLADELVQMVQEHGTEQNYTFVGPVAVAFVRDDGLSTGSYRVTSGVEAAGEAPPRPAPRPARTAAAAAPVAADSQLTQAIARPAPATHGALELPDGTRHPLTTDRIVVGRGKDADLRLADASVSRRHAAFTVVGDRVQIEDLGSTNGLTVNGERVQTATLSDGDTVVLGAATIVYRG
ncbi:MAG TPA: DUF3662 and FHA domain-containing protein [Mycobacteriales bacterium]